MRTTITVDDALFHEATRVLDESNASALVTRAFQAVLAAESRQRLARLGGRAPDFRVADRRSRGARVAEGEADYGTD